MSICATSETSAGITWRKIQSQFVTKSINTNKKAIDT